LGQMGASQKGGHMYKIQGRIRVQLPTERHSELGRLWERVFSGLASIEREYLEKGAERTVDYTRSAAATCLKLCCDGMRASYRILASHDPDMRSSLQENLELTLIPTPLTILFLELVELQNDRPSRLLTHRRFRKTSKGPYDLSRRFVTAKAIATIDVLVTTGLKRIEAVKRVADTLNVAKFPNPRKRPYSPKTVADWDKSRHEKKGDFDQLIDGQRRELEGLMEVCRQLEFSDEQARASILARLHFFTQAISYDYS